MEKFNLTLCGEDFWGRPTYKSDKGNYYKEVDGVIHTVCPSKDIDGEPGFPLKLKEGYELNLITEGQPAK